MRLGALTPRPMSPRRPRGLASNGLLGKAKLCCWKCIKSHCAILAVTLHQAACLKSSRPSLESMEKAAEAVMAEAVMEEAVMAALAVAVLPERTADLEALLEGAADLDALPEGTADLEGAEALTGFPESTCRADLSRRAMAAWA